MSSLPSRLVGALLGAALLAAPLGALQQSPSKSGPVRRADAVAVGVPSSSAPTCVAWGATIYTPASTVKAEGFLVWHEHPGGVEAYSSAARKWTPFASAGSAVVDSGDWCVLAKDPIAGIVAYSARLNNAAALPIPPTSSVVLMDCDDDVALVVMQDTSGAFTAFGYSAVWGAWVGQPLGSTFFTPNNYAISRFVIGVDDGGTYHGFAARTGGWASQLGVPGATMRADGNTLLADPTAAGFLNVYAFSGVRGCWSPSPNMVAGTAAQLDHNVAFVERDPGFPGTTSPTAYSAYRAGWFSQPVQPAPAGAALLSDNVVYFRAITPGLENQAFGAGHATWASLGAPNTLLQLDEDYALTIDTVSLDVHGFSGLCGGTFVFELNGTTAFPAPLVGPDHVGGFDTGIAMHTFRPAQNVWTPPLPKSPNDQVWTSDVTVEVHSLATATSMGTRYNPWVPTPAFGFNPTGTGSVVAHQDPTGTVNVFDERCDMWNPPVAFGFPRQLTVGRNVVLSEPVPGTATSIDAYSVQRCDWSSPLGFALPVVTSGVEENVAFALDSAGLLWGYGSSNDGQTYYQWPNGTEYLVSGPAASPGCKPTLFGYGVRSTPGNLSWVILGAPLQCPPIVVPGFCNELWLPITSTLYSAVGVHDLDCMVELRLPLTGTLLSCIQPWMQALTYDIATGQFCFGCRRADALWLF
ncbi:MAG: hypothetical protein R3F34_19640 [Planctomycetota bacterium]